MIKEDGIGFLLRLLFILGVSIVFILLLFSISLLVHVSLAETTKGETFFKEGTIFYSDSITPIKFWGAAKYRLYTHNGIKNLELFIDKGDTLNIKVVGQ